MMDYLFYVRFNLSGLRIYHCRTNDPFHVMGEMHYRCDEHIDRLTFTEMTDDKLKYWSEQGYKLYSWINKYEVKTDE